MAEKVDGADISPVKLLILDADGTLTPFRQGSTGAFERQLLPGVEDAIRTAREAGTQHIVLASNQGGARFNRPGGRITLGQVHAHMRWLCHRLSLDGYKFAVARSPRKKPNPGMLLEWMREFGVSPVDTVFVGDSESDRQAAEAAGCRFQWADEFRGVK